MTEHNHFRRRKFRKEGTPCQLTLHLAIVNEVRNHERIQRRSLRAGTTAIGTYGGALKGTAPELGATAIAESLRRSDLTPAYVQSVVLGQVVQAGAKMNPARQAAIHADLPASVPAMTVNRVCGSGAQAVVSAAREVMLGLVDCALAGTWKTWISRPIWT